MNPLQKLLSGAIRKGNENLKYNPILLLYQAMERRLDGPPVQPEGYSIYGNYRRGVFDYGPGSPLNRTVSRYSPRLNGYMQPNPVRTEDSFTDTDFLQPVDFRSPQVSRHGGFIQGGMPLNLQSATSDRNLRMLLGL